MERSQAEPSSTTGRQLGNRSARRSPTRSATQSSILITLQTSAGNGAVTSLVAQRQPHAGTAPAAPHQSSLADPTTAVATPFQATHPRMVDNQLVAPVVYPYRELMLRRFVAWHRDLELSTLSAEAQAQAIQYALGRIRAERDRLAGLPTQTASDRRELAQLESMLARAERGAAQALSVTHTWTHGHGGDELSGAPLEAEVRRLGTDLSLPGWEVTAILDYGGMRYGRSHAESGGSPTAHGSYFAPQRLLWAIETVRGGRTVPPDEANRLLGLSEAQALGRLQAMHAAGNIPSQIWRLITYRTDLRNDTTDQNWNDVNARDPAPTTQAEGQASAEWRRVMALWTQDAPVRGAHGGASGVVGATGWRAEMYRRRGVVALGAVCNELAEAIANQRGINLTGGITANAQNFAGDNGPRGMGTAATGRYFGRVDDEHLVPGANLFFIKKNWQREGHPWDDVIAVAGVQYPQRLNPGATGAAPNDPLPATPDADGWTYVAEAGSPVVRTRRPAAPTEGPEERQFMTWQHEATVAEVRGASVLTLETTGSPAEGGAGAGINERSKSSLVNDAGTFLGVDAGAHPAPAPPAMAVPAPDGPSAPPGPAGTSTEAPTVTPADVQNAVDSGRGPH